MSCEHNLIKDFRICALGRHVHAKISAVDTIDRRTKANVDAFCHHRCFQTFHIFNRATLNSVPLMLARSTEQGVVFEKRHHRLGREIHYLSFGRRPNRA